jgi:hypothetical protein
MVARTGRVRLPRGSRPAILGLCCATLLGSAAARADDSPKIQGEPLITGVAQEGATLTASAQWKGDPPAIVEWAWLRCSESGAECQDIADASGATYVPAAADVGRTLRVRVTWSQGDEQKQKQKQKQSAATEVVLAAVPTTPPAPVATPNPVPTPSAPAPAPVTPQPQPQPQPRRAAAPRPIARLRTLRPFPVIRIKGWLTQRGARITLLTVRAPRGAQIAVTCQGRSCPTPTLSRLRPFERELLAGTRLGFTVTRPGAIGKWTEIVIRRGALPRRRDGCLNSDTMRHRRCPA